MIRRRIGSRSVAAVGGVIAAVLALLAPMPGAAARAEQRLVVGLGIWSPAHADFVGFYKAPVDGRWTTVYCIRPASAAPTDISLRTLARLPHRSRTVTRQLAQTLAAHGDAATVVQAAAVSQALNEEVGNHRAVARRAEWLPDRVQKLAARYVAKARASHGPFRLSIDLPRSPLPGRSASGTVTLSSGGGPARGTVRLTHTANVQTPDEVEIGRSGRGRFRYGTVAGGPVHVAATAQVVPATLRASSPGADEQLMVTWSAPTTVRATATYQAVGPGISYRYACSSDCDGNPLVTLRACAPANDYRSRITFWLGDRVRRFTFDAAEARTCRSFQTPLADGVSVSATWRYLTPGGWTRPLPAAGAFVVDCPAPPPVAVAVDLTCSHARISATLGTQRAGELRRLSNATTHRMVLVVSGAAAARYALLPGMRAVMHTFRVPCGSGEAVTFRGGVQRTGGGYNYGAPVTITVP